jgi:peptidase E
VNNKKAVYLLAGGRGSGNTDPIIRAIFRDVGKASPTIAYVGLASQDNRDFFERMGAMIKRAGECRIIHALTYAKNADLNKAKDILKSADAVFVGGGDVELAMKVLEEKSITSVLPDLYERGKLFVGVSAGSIMLAKEWVRWRDPNDDSTAELFPCLGLAPVICDTHGEADDWEELKAALRLKQDGAYGYGITSGTCLKVSPDGKVEALGGAIYQYVRHDEAVQRQPDVLPYNF